MDLLSVFLTIIVSAFLLILLAGLVLVTKTYYGKSANKLHYPPIDGTVFHQLFYFNTLYCHQTETARKHPTFRLLAPDHSEFYTTDVRNIEHILKTNFDKYTKGKYSIDILRDLFGEGIFAVDGNKWRQQRKLSSIEFSTRVLRDFSCAVFRKNAAKLVRMISDFSRAIVVFDIHDILMRCTLDSIFKVGFGVDLNCLEGSSKEGIEFMKAFDDANALVYWRYVDPSWKIKRALNFGSENSLKKNIRVINGFVNGVITRKREQLAEQLDSAGPRTCLGKDFAYRQMKIVSIALLQFFRFKLGDETRRVTYRTMFTLHIQGGLHVKALPRLQTLS